MLEIKSGEFFSPPPEFKLIKQLKKDNQTLKNKLSKMEKHFHDLDNIVTALILYLVSIYPDLDSLLPSTKK